jgi:hypothetical protein
MRSVGKSGPEWGYLAPTPALMPMIRVALVATVIGAIGGAAVVVSLLERPGADGDNSSIAAHALVTGAPRTAVLPSPVITAARAHSPVAKPAASGELLAPSIAPASTTGTTASIPKPDKTVSPIPSVALLAEIPSRTEATTETGDTRGDAAPEIVPPEGKRHLTTKRWRHRRPRRPFGEYSDRGYGRTGSMHLDW